MPVRATKRGADRTPIGGAFDVVICGASFAGLAVARELRGTRRARTRARPLRDRRAPDVGLRRADGVAAQPRAGGVDPSDVRLAARAHAPCAGALAARLDVLDVRLPGAVRAAVGPARGPTEFETATVEGRAAVDGGQRGRAHRPRRRVRAARRRRARVEADPGLFAGAAAGRAALARTRGAPRRERRGPRAVDRQERDPRRLRLVVPCARRAARRRRLVRPARPRQAADGRAGERASGSLPRATRATGSRTGCGRRSRTACSSWATRPATACR